MKIVVTGSSGRLGSAVVRELAAHGHEVVPIDIRPPADPEAPATHLVDLKEIDQVLPLMEGTDAVCHLGNFAGFGRGIGDPAGFSNNMTGTYNVCHAAWHAGVERMVYASSIQAYGNFVNRRRVPEVQNVPFYFPVDEEHPLRPTGGYPLSKALGEAVVEGFVRRRPGSQAFSLRLTSIEVPGRHPRRDRTHEQEIRGAFAVGNYLTYINVEDAATVTRLCCEFDRPGHTPLNVVSPRARFPWSEQIIRDQLGKVPEFRRPLRPHEALVDASRLEAVLGFVPQRPPLEDAG